MAEKGDYMCCDPGSRPIVSCGCSSSSFVPLSPKECPNCQELMWVVVRTQPLELRLACQDCGYQGHSLSEEEIVELM